MAHARRAEGAEESARTAVLPRLDVCARDEVEREIGVFVRPQDVRLVAFHLGGLGRSARTDGRRAVRMDAPHVDALRRDVRHEFLHARAHALHEWRPRRHVVDRAHQHVLVALFQGQRDELQATMVGIVFVGEALVVLSAERYALDGRRRDVHFRPADFDGRFGLGGRRRSRQNERQGGKSRRGTEDA